jgi:hypothetical protein
MWPTPLLVSSRNRPDDHGINVCLINCGIERQHRCKDTSAHGHHSDLSKSGSLPADSPRSRKRSVGSVIGGGRGQIYARVSPPGPDRDMARVPDAACVEHVGLRLFLCPDGPVPDASRLLRHPAREQGDLPRCSDAASDSGLGRAANRGMLRLGSSATAILDSRSRRPLWGELRSSAMSVMWVRRKLRQVGEGSFGRHGMYLPTVA